MAWGHRQNVPHQILTFKTNWKHSARLGCDWRGTRQVLGMSEGESVKGHRMARAEEPGGRTWLGEGGRRSSRSASPRHLQRVQELHFLGEKITV